MAEHSVAVCVHCGESRIMAGRGLCRRCYSALKNARRLGEFPRKHHTADEYFASVDTSDVGACWYWTGRIDEYGYGRAGMDRAHRWSWMRANGPIPEGLVVDHNCHNLDLACSGGVACLHRRCINPAHLMLRTIGANTLASHSSLARVHAAKTHCPRGHEYNEANTYWNSTGRNCRPCRPLSRLELRERRGIVKQSVPSGAAAKKSISIDTARAIKASLDSGRSTQGTADQHGVSRRTVQMIKRGLHWSCREDVA